MSGIILKTTDGGTVWTPISSGSSDELLSVNIIDANTGFAAGCNGIILKTSNGGENWTIQASGTTNYLKSIQFKNTSVMSNK